MEKITKITKEDLDKGNYYYKENNIKFSEEPYFTVPQSHVNHYIANELDEKHPDYAKFVRGVKEFIHWVKNPISDNPQDKNK